MKIFPVFILILLIPIISAIQITEVELNPAGGDSGGEWVEFYCEDEVDLSGYVVKNNDGDGIDLDESCEGYYVYVFDKQWLDNTDEKIFLYNGEELVDSTDVFKDDKNNGLTWQVCDDDWEFVGDTRGEENECGVEEEEVDTPDDEIDNAEEIIISDNFEENNKVEKEKEVEIIKLNPTGKNIKGEENFESENNYAIYGFMGFCVLIVLLFVVKKFRTEKNEFRE